jgi:preprotein translocase subunit SecD
VVTADLSGAQDNLAAIESLEQVVQARLGAAGMTSNISQTSDEEITIEYTGDGSQDFVRRLIEVPDLNYREPIAANGFATCRSDDGEEFSVGAPFLSDGIDAEGNPMVICVTQSNTNGQIEWKEPEITSAMIQSAELKSSPAQGDVVLITFNGDGTGLFSALTQRTVGYPVGIFLGDQLVAAPHVQTAITDGMTVIAGVDADTRALVYAVVVGGELPFPVTSIEFQ